MDEILATIENELVGIWKFKTIDEGPNNRRWCASVNVAGRLVDTEDQPSILEALKRAQQLVFQLRREPS